MNTYAIKREHVEIEIFKILAEDEVKAENIFKEYGTYRFNKGRKYFIYRVETEMFSDMLREDYYLVGYFE